ncbi:rRNA-processing protein EFG1 [Amborella trichopoda]|uniref:rRNA-processing protein EFG1 n=1 Tax=Amborella trichopoda TaxID=13333 RepID=W1P3B2_AMBTC|nr:rRNA-processing protein EFG1 [Amborella trichopoda]XP_011621606.1 rRNA-processing protein EFG1 [Amborella trichopoda]ERN01445.1 hypothetical protein AMTR_s00002p00267210 [Amborella trichopoda]|eukprot:XP_006838876.1 rRNA-processing protein EFG1 [Amborella trichopoda]
MAHGGYGRRRVAERGPVGRRTRGPGVEKKAKPGVEKKAKSVSLKNQIRSIERMLLRKNLPHEVKNAQEARLEELKKQKEIETRLALERKMSLRYRRIKFFERRKMERRIRRLEKLQRTTTDPHSEEQIARQLSKLREDLEYLRFFPKTEKYLSLFVGGDDADVIDRRNRIREQIKANLMAAAASGKDLEETGSDDDGPLDVSEDDFFLTGSSSDEADADDEWTDKSTREQASSTSGKAASGMSSDEKNQRQMCARVLMPPPRSLTNSSKSRGAGVARFSRPSSSRNPPTAKFNNFSTSSNSSPGRSEPSASRSSSKARTGHSSNLSSNSDAHKPRRKRRPKKKKQA